MTLDFFDDPIVNSPYDKPGRHWELNEDGRPTNVLLEQRRRSELITPVPKTKRELKRTHKQEAFTFGSGDDDQEYDPTPIINEVRAAVDAWRGLSNPQDWQVTPTTEVLLKHWRHHKFEAFRPFFCQIEAVETAIWLTEVAPQRGKAAARFLEHLDNANAAANPGLPRLALKLATGAGKTTVMAMLIAWQAINAKRYPNSKKFSRGFLIVTPGITIRDRLRVLLPNDPDNYYKTREIVPTEMLQDLTAARVVITNYHAFKLRERMSLAKGTRQLAEGRGEKMQTLETEGQMLHRVMPELMGLKRITVINDEAHHCYRERPDPDADKLKGEEKKEANENREAARLWISGLEAITRQGFQLNRIYDLSATPFFLKGSGYREGTLFPWTMSDFNLMDAIECGIVKLPRVPVADNLPTGQEPIYRNLWNVIGKKMPKKARGEKAPDPLKLPLELQTALDALYGHYAKTYEAWEREGVDVPPVFIVVCNDTRNSKTVHDFIAGFEREDQDGNVHYHAGRLPLFRNYDEHGNRLARPRTLLIDSAQIESGESIDASFKAAAGPEIEKFRTEVAERSGAEAARSLTDEQILREVMNTVGKTGRLGEQIRCVVSVSMLTEGWDANTVTHIMGVRAFGTRLICEQVMGRALRRLSYDLDEERNRFHVEYADIMGIDGLNFAAQAVKPNVIKPRQVTTIRAERDREAMEIVFPRVEGYRRELPETRLTADFSNTEVYELSQAKVGPCEVDMQGIVGGIERLTLEYLEAQRRSTVIYHLTTHLIYEKFRDANEAPKINLFGQFKKIVRQWLDGGYLKCVGGTKEAQLLYKQIADEVCERIANAIDAEPGKERPIKAVLDPYVPTGSTANVLFSTTKPVYWTDARKCHLNAAVSDSGWEDEFCRVVEGHPRVLAYVKNHSLGFEVPYLHEGEARRYRPDFIVRLDDGRPDPLHLVVEIKGFRGDDASIKAETMRSLWLPGVNAAGRFGRWDFIELKNGLSMKEDFEQAIAGFIVHEAA